MNTITGFKRGVILGLSPPMWPPVRPATKKPEIVRVKTIRGGNYYRVQLFFRRAKDCETVDAPNVCLLSCDLSCIHACCQCTWYVHTHLIYSKAKFWYFPHAYKKYQTANSAARLVSSLRSSACEPTTAFHADSPACHGEYIGEIACCRRGARALGDTVRRLEPCPLGR